MLSLLEYFKKNKLIILFLFCSVFGFSLYANLSYFFKTPKQLAFFPPFIEGINRNDNKHLGAEYYCIAKALASGKGFSNPFEEETGPTAWMPPLYPFLLAFLIKLLHSTLRVACAIVFLKNIVLIFTGLIIYEIAQRTLTKIKAEWAPLFYIVFLLTNFWSFFQTTHDTWLLLFFICNIFPLAVFIRTNPVNVKTAVVWGVIGGLSMLASPIMGLVWCVLWAVMLSAKKNLAKLLLSFAVCFLLIVPWVIRNYVVFDKLLLVKSNLYFDAYFVNYEIKNGGLIKGTSFVNKHPIWTVKKDSNSLYEKLGEVKFMELYKENFLNSIKQNPYSYIRNIKNRAWAALFYYYPYLKHEKFIAWKTALHALPFICILCIVFLKGYAGSEYLKIALLMYGIYLIPYIAINYYIRYAIPLTPLKVLFTFWGIDLLIARLFKIKTHDTSNAFH